MTTVTYIRHWVENNKVYVNVRIQPPGAGKKVSNDPDIEQIVIDLPFTPAKIKAGLIARLRLREDRLGSASFTFDEMADL